MSTRNARSMIALVGFLFMQVGGFCQEQIVITVGTLNRRPIAVESTSYYVNEGFPGGFVDLEELRNRCDTVLVKLASWLYHIPGTDSVYLGLFYLSDGSNPDPYRPLQGRPFLELSSTSITYTKAQTEWVDLFDLVADARTERLGHLVASGRVGRQDTVGVLVGPTIILKCVPSDQ